MFLRINMSKKMKKSQKQMTHELIKGWLVDVWGHGAASQVGQVEGSCHGNKAGCHLQDG